MSSNVSLLAGTVLVAINGQFSFYIFHFLEIFGPIFLFSGSAACSYGGGSNDWQLLKVSAVTTVAVFAAYPAVAVIAAD